MGQPMNNLTLNFRDEESVRRRLRMHNGFPDAAWAFSGRLTRGNVYLRLRMRNGQVCWLVVISSATRKRLTKKDKEVIKDLAMLRFNHIIEDIRNTWRDK